MHNKTPIYLATILTCILISVLTANVGIGYAAPGQSQIRATSAESTEKFNLSASDNYIVINTSGIAPNNITINVGESVTWHNADQKSYTLTTIEPLFGTATQVGENFIYLPLITNESDTNLSLLAMAHSSRILNEGDFRETVAPGEDFTYTFNTPGTILVYIEENVNFFGSITVETKNVTGINGTSPADGENDVAVTRETIIEFDVPLSTSSVTAENFYASFGGQRLDARLHHSADGQRVTLFYNDSLPASARVQVTLDGDSITDANGNAIDADNDGNPGGVGQLSFDTLSLTTLAGTSVCGRVFASELEQIEAAHVAVNQPLQDATITVDGQEDVLRTVTDASGNFCLDPAPAGRFFVHIDGRTATNGIPNGAYYPFVGKAWESVIGQQVNVGNIYLPLINPGTLQDVSTTQDTRITFTPSVAEAFPELKGTEILVPSSSLFADNGTEGGKVGISPVPPDRLPGQLPPGLNFPIVITVQTDGATNFDVPAPVCFPNLPDSESNEKLNPGEKSALWSFNHDTGRFEVVGPMTVSDDGQLVCTDPGVGIEAPGWHGSQPGSPGNPPRRPPSYPGGSGNGPGGGSGNDPGGDDPGGNDPGDDDSSGGDPSGDDSGGDDPGGNKNDPPPKEPSGCRLTGGEIRETIVDAGFAAATCLAEISGFNDSIKFAISLASDIRTLESDVRALLDSIRQFQDNDDFDTQMNVTAAAFKVIRSTKAGIVNDMEVVKNAGIVKKVQKALICAESVMIVIENVCGRITSKDGCTGFWVRVNCTGVSGVRFTLSQINRLADKALDKVDHAVLTAVCIAVDQFATLFGLPAGDIVSASYEDSIYQDNPPELSEAIALLEGLLAEVEILRVEYEAVEEYFLHVQALDAYLVDLERNSGLLDQPSWDYPANAYYLVENGGIELRGMTNQQAQFDVILRPESDYTIWLYDPVADQVGMAQGKSAIVGQETLLADVDYRSPFSVTGEFADGDNDNLTDLIERIIGTDANNVDTDQDGSQDGVEARQGTNPLDGIAVSLGIIATADTPGTAVDICAANDLIAVADSDAGVSLFNVFNGMNPTIIKQVDTPGSASAVACGNGWVVVADDDTDLAILDVTDPANARLTQQIEIDTSTQAVAIAGNVAYVGAGSTLAAVELTDGTILDQIDLSASVQDISTVGDVLYVLTEGMLHTLTLTPDSLDISSSTESPGSIGAGRRRSRLFVALDVLYATHTRGYNTFDISHPLQPRLIAAGETAQFGWKQLVTNGTGSGIAAVSPNSTGDGAHDISLYDVSDPVQTDRFITTFETPGLAAAVALYNDQAYVADSNAGMQVINYLSADTQGITPTLSLATNFAAGVAEERTTMRISADATDDVQVRNVEFYIDGNQVAIDGNYPFETWIATPALADQSSFTLQAKATDTGGNTVWSSSETIELVADATPPLIAETTPQNRGFIAPDTQKVISVVFNEPMDTTAIQDANVQLFGAGVDRLLDTNDDQLISVTVAYDGETTKMTLNLENPLSKGRYRVIIDGNMTDVAGNPIKGGEYAWSFTVGIAVWDGGGDDKSWHDPLNWELDQIPIDGAVVLIDSVGAEPISYERLDSAIKSVHSVRPVRLQDGILTINEDSVFDQLIQENGTLSGTGNITVTSILTWTRGTMSGSGKTIAQNRLILNGSRMTLDERTLENRGTAMLGGNNTQHILFENGGILNNLAGATFHDQSRGQFSMDTLLDDSTPVFNNMGTYILDIPSDDDFNRRSMNIHFNNLGTVQIQSGELSLIGGESSNQGEIGIADGATLSMGGIPFLFTFDTGSKISGDGVLHTRNGTVDVKTDITLKNLIHGNATLTGTGDIQVTDTFTWTDGTIGGTGTIRSEGQLYLSGPSLVLDGRVFDNAGTALWSWDTTSQFRRSLHLRNNAIFNNLANATFTDEEMRVGTSTAIWGDNNAAVPQFNNAGMYIKRGNPTETVVEASLSNLGTIHVQSGILRLKDGSNSDIIDIDESATMQINGIFENREEGQLIGTGTLDIMDATFTDNGAIAPSITIAP